MYMMRVYCSILVDEHVCRETRVILGKKNEFCNIHSLHPVINNMNYSVKTQKTSATTKPVQSNFW